MINSFLSLLLLLLQLLFPAPTSGSPEESSVAIVSLASLREVCQFVYDGYEKMPDAASDEGAVHQYEEFTTEWSVRVSGGRETAEAIAERHGFINNGPVSRCSRVCSSYA